MTFYVKSTDDEQNYNTIITNLLTMFGVTWDNQDFEIWHKQKTNQA